MLPRPSREDVPTLVPDLAFDSALLSARICPRANALGYLVAILQLRFQLRLLGQDLMVESFNGPGRVVLSSLSRLKLVPREGYEPAWPLVRQSALVAGRTAPFVGPDALLDPALSNDRARFVVVEIGGHRPLQASQPVRVAHPSAVLLVADLVVVLHVWPRAEAAHPAGKLPLGEREPLAIPEWRRVRCVESGVLPCQIEILPALSLETVDGEEGKGRVR